MCFGACVTGEAHATDVVATRAELVSGETCDPANAQGVAARMPRALLDTIAYAEGTRGHGKDGYNVGFAYQYFDSCEVHPNIKTCSGSYCSTAAGRYQFLSKTYDGLKLANFWPESQERGALELIRRRGVSLPDAAMTATQFANALDKLSYEWASLPPGRYGQSHFSIDEVRTEYCDLARCSEPNVSTVHTAPGFVTIERDGLMYQYQSDALGKFTSRVLTSGWDNTLSMGAGADYDEDGRRDLITVDAEYGLELQRGDGTGDYVYRPLTLDAGRLVAIGGAADYDGDAHADFLATDDRGALLLVHGDGKGWFQAQILSHYGDDVLAIAGGPDYDGASHADFVTLRADGSAVLYSGDGAAGFDVRLIALEGGELILLGGGADYDLDGHSDLIGVAADGGGYLFAGRGDGSFEPQRLGNGWDWVRFID
jgi:muramidase (phage lysozyme)